MTMTAEEQDAINQAMQSAGLEQVIIVKDQGGENVYQLCQLTPIRTMTPAEAADFAVIYGEAIASP